MNDLITAGKAAEPQARTFWVRGTGDAAVVLGDEPRLKFGAVPYTCNTDRAVIADFVVTFVDATSAGEFRVSLKGSTRIPLNGAQTAIAAQLRHGGLDIAAREALRRSLENWGGRGGLLNKLFPQGGGAAADAVHAAVAALAVLGLDIDAPTISPIPWNADDPLELALGPRRVSCADGGSALNASLKVHLEVDPTRYGAFLTSKVTTAGSSSIRSQVEKDAFDWLEGRYFRHQHTYAANLIKSELTVRVNAFCGERFGRKVRRIHLDNGVASIGSPEDELFDFAANYKIAASKASVEMSHRCRVVISDVGRAPGGLAQRQREAEARIKVAVQTRILSMSEDKIAAELHTFRGTRANALSEWAVKDAKLEAELAVRGLSLHDLYIFTDYRKSIPVRGVFRHTTKYPIRGTERMLELSHDVVWSVGESRQDESSFIERGAPTSEHFEKEVLGRELDLETQSLLQSKSFGEIVFEFFQDQEGAEDSVSKALGDKLAALARTYGVQVSSVTTVFTQLPEAALLRGEMLSIDPRNYALAETSDEIELSASMMVRLPPSGDGSKLKQQLSGDDPEGVFTEIKSGTADQIRHFMGDVEPWDIFAMRESGGTEEGGTIKGRLTKRVDTWLKDTFGLELDPAHGFVLQIGACILLDARRRLIGLEDQVLVEGEPTSRRANLMIGTEVRVEAQVTVPFRVVGVSSKPGDSRRFMEALRASNGADGVHAQIRSIIKQAITGLMQFLPLEAFIQANFSSRRFRELIADLAAMEVQDELGLEIITSPNRVLPSVKGAIASHEAIELQTTLTLLVGRREEEMRGRDPDYRAIDDYNRRINVTKTALETITALHGVGGTQDQQALIEASRRITEFLDQRNIPLSRLPRYNPPLHKPSAGEGGDA